METNEKQVSEIKPLLGLLSEDEIYECADELRALDDKLKDLRKHHKAGLWTIRETASHFGVTPASIYNWRREGGVLHGKETKVGKRVFFRKEEMINLDFNDLKDNAE